MKVSAKVIRKEGGLGLRTQNGSPQTGVARAAEQGFLRGVDLKI